MASEQLRTPDRILATQHAAVDAALADLAARCLGMPPVAALGAHPLGYDGRGDFDMDALGKLTRREEMKLAPFVWTGLQILHPRLFDGAPAGRF